MPRTRVSPKTWKGTKKGWPSKTRSFPWRKGSAKPTMALSGMKTGVSNPSSVHRFTRWAASIVVDLQNSGAVPVPRSSNSDAGTTNPITVGGATTTNTPAGTGESFGGNIKFMIDDLPGATDFTSLFDHYTIEQVDIEVNCLQNTAAVNVTNADNVMPSITYVPDFDDSAVPTTGASIREYQRARTHTFRGSGKPLKFSIKPRTAVAVYRTAISSAYAAGAEGTALNLSYTDVPHYGIKFWVDNMAFDLTNPYTACDLQFRMKYHLKFQDPK